jgi:hypothetical protein
MRIYASIAIMIIGSTFYNYLWYGAYYQSIAAGIFLLFWELKVRVKSIGAVAGFWFSLSNLADELFFNPKAIQLNEYIFAVIIILATYKKYASDTGR